MRSAPPVVVICQGGLAWAGLLMILPATTGAALATWISAWAEFSTAGVAVVVLAAAALASLLGRRWLNCRAEPLMWDGACWSAGSPATPGQVEVMIDLGGWLLLRFRPESTEQPVCWLPVSAAAAGHTLHGLRVALHGSPARPRHAAAGPRGTERQPG